MLVPPSSQGSGRPHGAWARALVVAAVVVVAACPRPPVGDGPDDDIIPGRSGSVDLSVFVQDRPAIAGKWYEYDPDTHLLEPKAEAWIVRDDDGAGGVRHAAFRVVSYYDTETGSSGLFTLGIAQHDGAAWSAFEPVTLSANILDGDDVCLDVYTATEAPCAGDGWQLRASAFRYLSPLAALVVKNPGLFLSDNARAARVEGVSDAAALPDPTTISTLDDAPPAGWDSTEWPYTRFAPDLPAAGMAIGQRFVDAGFVGRGDVWFLFSSRFDVSRFTVAPVVEGDVSAGVRFATRTETVDDNFTLPEAFAEPATIDVAAPAVGAATYLRLDAADLLSLSEDVADAQWPHAPPDARRFDLVLLRPSADALVLLVSPAAAVLNATGLGLPTDLPPTSQE